ncbi:DUF975 family protein [Papillibacter cinnamivorans]|uniref:DUF975 family protein n=1 Tax=Papillibacter cinnamivorans DSM 12816 TaxID=1122930 RepID=A0A1W2BIS6_9FIRM|nr:DUF975 family protein [Papillibacter cinnamivorans]SMC72602.1 Protein of unknown function [Papillibacter cinnamivorans DSM 12816]
MVLYEMKEKARDDMARAKPRPIGMAIIYLLIIGALSLMLNYVTGGVYLSGRLADPGLIWLKLILQFLAGLFQIVLTVGFRTYCLSGIERRPSSFSALFAGFRDFGRILRLSILMDLYILLRFLLLIVPGIIAIYRCRMAYFLIIDNPHMTAKEAIRASSLLMNGRKSDLFLLDLSFIGWALLAVPLSFVFWRVFMRTGLDGVYGTMLAAYCLGLWLVPYFNFTNAVFYRNAVKENGDQVPVRNGTLR